MVIEEEDSQSWRREVDSETGGWFRGLGEA